MGNSSFFFLLVLCAERGIYILYDDVRSCQCEDVHVLWSILVESHGLPPPPPPMLSLKR